jgi:hypothetical protein
MMGFGFLAMLLVIALPIVGIVALINWLSNANRQGNLFGLNSSSERQEQTTSSGSKRFCFHCGAGMQVDWTHCPQCGAPVGS